MAKFCSYIEPETAAIRDEPSVLSVEGLTDVSREALRSRR